MKFRDVLKIAVAMAVIGSTADASHNRGSVLIPSIDGNGNLTIAATSFWRTTAPDEVNLVSITGPGGFSVNLNMGPNTVNTADARFTRVDETASTSIMSGGGGAGVYTISWQSCCRIAGIANAAESSMGTTSTIFWDGKNSTKPITFDIQNIQPNVVRGSNYSDNLDVTSANGDTLSYDDTVLTVNINPQAPGFSISNTGQINIPGASTAGYPDNTSDNGVPGNPYEGADVAFSGQINATSGGRTTGSVQFDWLFDAVAQGNNNVPDVADVVINATVGDTINTNITGTDPNAGDVVTLSYLSFTGPGGNIAGSIFTPGTPGNPVSGNFVWNSTGFGPGTYIATILGSDGGLTDQGTITINLTNGGGGPSVVPLPAGAVLFGTALAGFGLIGRRRK